MPATKPHESPECKCKDCLHFMGTGLPWGQKPHPEDNCYCPACIAWNMADTEDDY